MFRIGVFRTTLVLPASWPLEMIHLLCEETGSDARILANYAFLRRLCSGVQRAFVGLEAVIHGQPCKRLQASKDANENRTSISNILSDDAEHTRTLFKISSLTRPDRWN